MRKGILKRDIKRSVKKIQGMKENNESSRILKGRVQKESLLKFCAQNFSRFGLKIVIKWEWTTYPSEDNEMIQTNSNVKQCFDYDINPSTSKDTSKYKVILHHCF